MLVAVRRTYSTHSTVTVAHLLTMTSSSSWYSRYLPQSWFATTETDTDAISDEMRYNQERLERLQKQYRAEEQAARNHASFVPHQRVYYYHKATQTTREAWIVAVHTDDGPPYYTIRMDTTEERQTTRDRLQAAEWNAHKTWEILSGKKKINRN